MSLAVELVAKVMQDVRALSKDQRNKDQGFMFRGIDDVMGVVGPALRQHGLVVQSETLSNERDSYDTKSGTRMSRAVVGMRYLFTAPDDTVVWTEAYGEAADAGDKCVSKAMSVAYRTAILQMLCLPTGEPDPDETSHERVQEPAQPQGDPRNEAFAYLRSVVRVKGLGDENVPAAFMATHGGKEIAEATVDELIDYAAQVQRTGTLEGEPPHVT